MEVLADSEANHGDSFPTAAVGGSRAPVVVVLMSRGVVPSYPVMRTKIEPAKLRIRSQVVPLKA